MLRREFADLEGDSFDFTFCFFYTSVSCGMMNANGRRLYGCFKRSFTCCL